MPNRKTHERISRIFVNKSCKETHKVIDFPYKFLGRKHRIFFHDPISAMVIGYIANGDEGVVSGLLHIVTDYISTEIKKYSKT